MYKWHSFRALCTFTVFLTKLEHCDIGLAHIAKCNRFKYVITFIISQDFAICFEMYLSDIRQLTNNGLHIVTHISGTNRCTLGIKLWLAENTTTVQITIRLEPHSERLCDSPKHKPLHHG